MKTIKTKPTQTDDEFTRFEELTRKLVSVPKKDVEKEEKKFKKGQEKKKRV
jgi:hypothetical protein